MLALPRAPFPLALCGAIGAAALVGSCTRSNSSEGVGVAEADAGIAALCSESPSELFEQRIAPILADDRPTSCNECHLSGINLSLFVRPTPCESMACMREQDLVDFSHPERSLVLSWIERASPVSDLITQDVIDEEYAAFRHWIEYSAACHDDRCAGVVCTEAEEDAYCPVAREPIAGTEPQMWDPGGCGEVELATLFRDTFYAARGRCFPCHFDNQPNAPAEAPRWISTRGDCDTAARETMRNIIEAGYVDVEQPERSLVILKPLAVKQGGVEHEGHDKITKDGDAAYDYLTYWLGRYAECVAPADAGTH